jgi:2'-hydroxyisoflavone reductase
MQDLQSPQRRQLMAAAAGLAMSSGSMAAALDSPKPLNILILGGTGFIGPHQVRYALERGHKLTLFNRGRRPKEWPAHVEEVTGDRDTNDYEVLKGRKWDVCIDNPTTIPAWVRGAAAVLKGNVGQYIFVSTVSVYSDDTKPGQDVDAPRAVYKGADPFAETTATLRKDIGGLYGPLKALSEDEVNKQFAGMATIVRPGLIVGPGDETDRYTYWPVRLARGGKVLAPPLADPVKYIDARDLGEWIIRLAEQRTFGAFNAIGPKEELKTGTMLEGINRAVGGKAQLVPATAKWLEDHKVEAWSDLPMWVPGEGETAGFHRRSVARSFAAGLKFRPVEETARDTLAWWNAQDEKRRAKLRAGLSPEREAELLAQLAG